ncbi:MAG: hypothetical protein ACAI35_24040, partial [Candidatus Methylacidiphilales bacterium]
MSAKHGNLFSEHRLAEVFAALEAFADEYITCLLSLNADTDVGLNDLHMHMLFGALCCLADLHAVLAARPHHGLRSAPCSGSPPVYLMCVSCGASA